MLNVVIFARGRPDALVRTLGSLIPAIPEGVLRDGWILDEARDEEMAAIADAAGCTYCIGGTAALPEPVVAERLLLIAAGAVLEEGWWREVADLLAIGPGLASHPIVFAHADARYGFAPRLVEWRQAMARLLPFLASTHHAVIAGPGTLGGEMARIRMPARLRGRLIRLRNRAVVTVQE